MWSRLPHELESSPSGSKSGGTGELQRLEDKASVSLRLCALLM